MLPAGSGLGERVARLLSIKRKSFGDAAQTNGVLAPSVLLMRVMFRLNNVPLPLSAVEPSFTKAEIRNVFIGPPPGRTLPETFQLLAVRPAGATGGDWKLTTVESKVQTPRNPISLSPEIMVETVTGWVKLVADVSTFAVDNETIIELGVGVGVGAGV